MHDAPRISPAWVTVAAAILALQGVGTIFYAGLLPAPGGIDAAVDLPLLGRAPLVSLGLGALDLVAAAGVYGRHMWGRYLGIVAVLVSIAMVTVSVRSLGMQAVFALMLPNFVLFALWRRWP